MHPPMWLLFFSDAKGLHHNIAAGNVCDKICAYVMWLGKGEKDEIEWGFRFYSKDSTRPNRISAYIWNANGGLGSSAYFQDELKAHEWLHAIWRSTTPARGRRGRTQHSARQSRPLTRGCVSGWGLPPSRRYR